MTLYEVSCNVEMFVEKVDLDSDSKQRLIELGIFPNVVMKKLVRRIAGTLVRVLESTIVLNNDITKHIYVKEMSSE